MIWRTDSSNNTTIISTWHRHATRRTTRPDSLLQFEKTQRLRNMTTGGMKKKRSAAPPKIMKHDESNDRHRPKTPRRCQQKAMYVTHVQPRISRVCLGVCIFCGIKVGGLSLQNVSRYCQTKKKSGRSRKPTRAREKTLRTAINNECKKDDITAIEKYLWKFPRARKMKRYCDCRVRNNNDKTPRNQNIENVNVSQARLGKKAQIWKCSRSHQTESWKQLPENKNFRSSTVDVNEINCRRHGGWIDWNSSPQREACEWPLFVGLATSSVAACAFCVHFLIMCSAVSMGCQVFWPTVFCLELIKRQRERHLSTCWGDPTVQRWSCDSVWLTHRHDASVLTPMRTKRNKFLVTNLPLQTVHQFFTTDMVSWGLKFAEVMF